jgi:hypothetical protein
LIRSRRRGLTVFALGSALSAWAYVVLPLGDAWLVFAIGFPLGFFGSGIFSGLAVYLAELRASVKTLNRAGTHWAPNQDASRHFLRGD